MKNRLLIYLGKLISLIFQITNVGSGSTWPGHIALKLNSHFVKDFLKKSNIKIIFVVGTNGKTTTTTLLSHLLSVNGIATLQNTSGANLVNGIASTLIRGSDLLGKCKADVLLLEIDENAFTRACKEITPNQIVMLNLFRDQLDRYGEVNSIAKNWKETIKKLPAATRLFLNADDPQIAFLGEKIPQTVTYFGLNEKGTTTLEHASDSTYCPKCGNRLIYKKIFYSHLGIWSCPTKDLLRPLDIVTAAPYYPLSGTYNKYNTIAAVLVAETMGVVTKESLLSFKPAFGRQEKLSFKKKDIEIILAKNPAGFNQTLETVTNLGGKHLLVILNDKIADGTDVSWIWDVDFEKLKSITTSNFTISGERAYDLALRFKYSDLTFSLKADLPEALNSALAKVKEGETLYILPTYTAMLEVRKLLLGRRIL